jgi:hypothetical protein
MVAKICLAIGLLLVLFGGLWVEQSHRVELDAAVPTGGAAALDAGCPVRDTLPYTAGCLEFLEATANGRPTEARVQASPVPGQAESAREPPCPSTDGVPYTERCIAYLSSWYWRPN